MHVHLVTTDDLVEKFSISHLDQWEGNQEMFNIFKKSIAQKFNSSSKLKIKANEIRLYEPNENQFIDDIHDFISCYSDHKKDYDFILSLYIYTQTNNKETQKKKVCVNQREFPCIFL